MRYARFVAAAAVLAAAACGDYGGDRSYAPAVPVVATLVLQLAVAEAEMGQFTQATAQARDQYGSIITAQVAFASSDPGVAGINPTTGQILAIGPGTTTISASAGGKVAAKTLTVVPPPLFINEVTPLGDAVDGWVELYNPTARDVELGGWTITNANVFQSVRIPDGARIPAGGFVVLDELIFPAGLGQAGTVHLFSKFGVQSDAFVWGHDPGTSFGRCPDGESGLIPTETATRGTPNHCF